MTNLSHGVRAIGNSVDDLSTAQDLPDLGSDPVGFLMLNLFLSSTICLLICLCENFSFFKFSKIQTKLVFDKKTEFLYR